MAASFCPRSIRRPQAAPTIRPAPFPTVGPTVGRPPHTCPSRINTRGIPFGTPRVFMRALPAERTSNGGPLRLPPARRLRGSCRRAAREAGPMRRGRGRAYPPVTAASAGDTSPCRGGQGRPIVGAAFGRLHLVSFGQATIGRPYDWCGVPSPLYGRPLCRPPSKPSPRTGKVPQCAHWGG